MKALMVFSALLLGSTATMAADEVSVESPGYEALVDGQNALAIRQIHAQGKISTGDPATMINLGSAYVRTGRDAEAAELFRAAMQSPAREIELADGTVTTTKVAARKSLRQLESRVATR